MINCGQIAASVFFPIICVPAESLSGSDMRIFTLESFRSNSLSSTQTLLEFNTHA
jgi:hypothetical protein